MTTVAQAFEQFIQRLELSEGERSAAQRQERLVFEALRQRLGPRESILSGSYGRKTAIRPLHDIDLFLIFPKGKELRPGTGVLRTPIMLLEDVKWALENAFPGKKARLQNRSVNIEFTGTGIGFDVVPALDDQDGRGYYLIPDQSLGRFIPSNPRRHIDVCNEANERSAKQLKPLVKALKCWNEKQERRMRSFLLEVMAYRAIRTFRPDPGLCVYAQGVKHLFAFMSEHILESWDEPAGLGPAVNAGVEKGHLAQGQQRLTGAARTATRALEAERKGNMADANLLWRELLGEAYLLRVDARG